MRVGEGQKSEDQVEDVELGREEKKALRVKIEL